MQEEYKYGELVNKTLYDYYENGQIESEKNYKDGKLEGKFIDWYKNGQKFIEGNYKDFKPDDKWTFWKKNGKKEEERFYKDNILVEEAKFMYSFFTGKLKSVKKYKNGICISGGC